MKIHMWCVVCPSARSRWLAPWTLAGTRKRAINLFLEEHNTTNWDDFKAQGCEPDPAHKGRGF